MERELPGSPWKLLKYSMYSQNPGWGEGEKVSKHLRMIP